jgi:hypothetical protein
MTTYRAFTLKPILTYFIKYFSQSSYFLNSSFVGFSFSRDFFALKKWLEYSIGKTRLKKSEKAKTSCKSGIFKILNSTLIHKKSLFEKI